MAGDLEAQARRFANETSDLLNGTVCRGVRISTLRTPRGDVIMGPGIKKTRPDPAPIPITTGSKARVFLYLIHSYCLDPEGEFLTMASSTLSLYSSPDMSDEHLVVGIDYIREPANRFPGCHLHVYGERSDMDAIYIPDPSDPESRRSRTLRDLHLPVGGRRFRPTLEDLIEFMVTERMVIPHDGWEDVVNAHRARWNETQLKAAVRRSPEHAADALRARGWTVIPPE